MVAAALGDGDVRLIQLADGSQTAVAAHRGAVRALAFHEPTGDFLTGGDDGRLCRVSREGGSAEVHALGSRWVEHVVADVRSGWAAASMGREVHLFTPDLEHAGPLPPLPSTATALTLDPAHGRLAAAHYGGVSLNGVQPTGAWAERVWKGSHLAVSLSPDGRWLVSATQEHALHVWPMDGGEDCGMRGYPGKPLSLAWSADSRLLLTSGLDSLAAWRFDGPGPAGREPLLLGWAGGGLIVQVAAHPKAPAAAAGCDNGALLFADLDEERAVLIEEPDGREISALSWTSDGLALAVGRSDGEVTVFDMAGRSAG